MKPKAVVTGASSGIGREIALYLSQIGYYVVLVGRNEDSLEAVRKEIGQFSETVKTDLSVPNNARLLFEAHKNADVIVNCAGLGVFGEFDLTDLDRELEMLNTNVLSLHVLTKLYYVEFNKRGKGRILNVSSSASYFIGPAFSSYYASKAYVTRLTRAVQTELKRNPTGVTVTLFCPGPVKTAFGKKDGISDGSGAITAAVAAKKAVDGMLKGKEIVFPNFLTKLSVLGSKILPECITARFVYKIQIKKSVNSALPIVNRKKV